MVDIKEGNGRTDLGMEGVSNAGDKKEEQRDLICFSHLRWDHVFQRPHHLISRFANHWRVFFIEEPHYEEAPPRIELNQDGSGVRVVKSWLDPRIDGPEKWDPYAVSLWATLEAQGVRNPIAWYYTPMALKFSRNMNFSLVVYDVMDELSSFAGAPPDIELLEEELVSRADLVFTGGRSLYEAKKGLHRDVHLFPSSVDRDHFAKARDYEGEPVEQTNIPHPRLGYFGVIDERMDFDLLKTVAQTRPDWQLVMVGPTAKVEEEKLPRLPNIHYLGMKPYGDLPAYLASWDVALIPFANNSATRYISPTKTPEYLAGGVPVVSTAIRDIVRPYGELGLVWVASTTAQFISAVENAIELNGRKNGWLEQVDHFLAEHSWDKTWEQMKKLVEDSLHLQDDESVDLSIEETPTSQEDISLPEMPSRSQARLSLRPSVPYDYLVVGAGFAGSVLAERLARGSGKKVLIVDRRPHIGGNAYDHYNDAGILIHRYGPHIFHTNSKDVFSYLSRFTDWRPYEHRVLASVDGMLLPIPINLDTVNRLFGLNLNSMDVEEFYESLAENIGDVKTSEDVVVSRVGRDLYEKFFRNYTRKQWGLDPSELDASVTSRVPIRENRDDRYFTDVYQAMPLHGYTRMFENMLDHPNIHIMVNTDYRDIAGIIPYNELVYTGPVDEYFDYCYGKLPYRSLQFRFETSDIEQIQPVAVINYPNEHPYTRVTEFKHLTGQEHRKTTRVYEYPCSEGDPYYPIPRQENADLYKRYKELADQQEGVYFAGRLATYRYYNMDQVTAQALTLYARMTGQRRREVLSVAETSFIVEMPCTLLASEATEA